LRPKEMTPSIVVGGGIMLATAMFVTLGLPVTLISIFAGIDAFVDMARTTTNVTSSMVAAKLVAQSEEKKKAKTAVQPDVATA